VCSIKDIFTQILVIFSLSFVRVKFLNFQFFLKERILHRNRSIKNTEDSNHTLFLTLTINIGANRS